MMQKSRREMHDKVNTSPVQEIGDSANSEKKYVTTNKDYKKILGKRLYELESESMPAT